MAPPIALSSTIWWSASQRPNKKIGHPIHPIAVVLAESELVQIALHMLGADMDVCLPDAALEQLPEAFDMVDVMPDACLVGLGILLDAMLDGAVAVALFGG